VDWVDSLEYNLPQAEAILQLLPNEEKCKPELCAKLEWEGNADLAGIGVGPVSVCRHILEEI